tara:strand:- start:1764 stop:2309 length:546 start_codon:yes stop_codon:yes gene_type:complete
MQVIKQFYDIDKKVKDIAEKISLEYKDTGNQEIPVFICVLQGGAMFFHDLIKSLKVECCTEYVRLKSYKGKTASTPGNIKILSDIQVDIKGKPIYIIDDIIDTGATMAKLMSHLSELEPAYIKTVTLVERKAVVFKSDYCCFRNMGDEWFVGYGFDKDGKCRNYKNLYSDGKVKKVNEEVV